MHLPDHYLDPKTCAVTAVLAGGAIAYSLARLRRSPAPNAPSIAATGAVIFAAQMIDFPIASGASGHLLGGALAGVLLGPWAGLVAIASVLTVQAAVFGDGGILALGANILNMGVIAVGIGSAVGRVAQKQFGRRIAVVAIAAWLSIVAAALASGLEMAASGAAASWQIVSGLVAVHALIGFAEAAITCAVVGALYHVARRSDCPNSAPVPLASTAITRRHLRLAFLTILPVLLLAAIAPFSSPLPDGLSRVADALVQTNVIQGVNLPSLLSDYALPGVASPTVSTALAALLGSAVVSCLATAAATPKRRFSACDSAAVR